MYTLNKNQRRAIDKVWANGLTEAQIRLIHALDSWFDEYAHGPSLIEMMARSGLSYDAVRSALPVLEEFGYVWINRDRKGRVVPRGVILQVGFDWTKDL